MAFRIFRSILVLLALCIAAPGVAQPKPPLVLAAASLQESLTAAAEAWAARGHPKPVLSFAASSALARQVEAGAPADLFLAADQEWMDELASRQLIDPGSRVTFLCNRLVIVAAAGTLVRAPLRAGPLAKFLSAGPIAMADAAVPAGKYGRAALTRLGVWDAVQSHVVGAENVRAALALVERGAAPLGIVYATDARASAKVRIAGVFPASSHPPITYPLARLKTSSNPEGEAFRRFLVSPAGKAIFLRYGFSAR